MHGEYFVAKYEKEGRIIPHGSSEKRSGQIRKNLRAGLPHRQVTEEDASACRMGALQLNKSTL